MKRQKKETALSPILIDNPNSPNRLIQRAFLLMVGRRNEKGGATVEDLVNEIKFALGVLEHNRLVQEHEGRYLLTSKGEGVLEKVRQPSYVRTADVTDGVWWNSECKEPVIVRDGEFKYFGELRWHGIDQFSADAVWCEVDPPDWQALAKKAGG